MGFTCPICLDSDMDGRVFQCDNGHSFCARCYDDHVEHQKWQGSCPICATCRIKLVKGTPVRSLGLEQEIAAKKEATRAEVQLAIDEADQNMIVDAIAAADAQEAQKAEAEAVELVAHLQEKEQRNAKDAAREADASALANAQSAGDGDLEAQAARLAEYEAERVATVKRRQREEHIEKYEKKLRKSLASEPDPLPA